MSHLISPHFTGEALKLARKLDNEEIIGLVDKYVQFCGLSVTCKSPDQIKLSRKPGRSSVEIAPDKDPKNT